MLTLLGHGLSSSIRYMLGSMPGASSLSMRVYMLTHESNLLFHGVNLLFHGVIDCDPLLDGYWLVVAYVQDGKRYPCVQAGGYW